MNSDDLMSDIPTQTGEGHFADPTISPSTDNPTKFDSQTATTAGSAAGSSGGPGAWNTKKFRDEYEIAKSRLVDQNYNSSDIPDPLLPRQTALKQYPAGVTAETEKMLKDLIAEIRAGSA